MSGPPSASPSERTDLAWQRTGLGLLAVGSLLAARALQGRAPALLVAAGAAALFGLAVLGVLAPLRRRSLQRRAPAARGVAAPRAVAAVTSAVVLVGVAAAVAVLAVPVR